MTRPVVIVGAGHLGKLLFDCLAGDDRWRAVAFIDDGLAGGQVFGLPVFASDTYDRGLASDGFLAIGFPKERRAMLARVAPLCLSWPNFIDRQAMVGHDAHLGEGALVLSFAMVASGVTLGSFTYLSSYAHVGTGAVVGDFTSILPGASIGKSVVGDNCVIGLKSACLDGASVGNGVTVAPYTLVRKAIPAGALVAGNPGRIRRVSD